MGYAFDGDETVPDAVRRITDEQVERAVSALEQVEDNDLTATVHDCRKRAKKLRGLLRLVRPAMGEAYGPANEAFRDAGRELSAIRDAHATLATFHALVAASLDRLPEGGLGAVRSGLAAYADRASHAADRRPRAESAADLFRAGRRHVSTPNSTSRGGRRSDPASSGPTGPAAARWQGSATIAASSPPACTSGASGPRTPGTTSGCCATRRRQSWSHSRIGSTASPTPSATPTTSW